jgi:hypothetical protein
MITLFFPSREKSKLKCLYISFIAIFSYNFLFSENIKSIILLTSRRKKLGKASIPLPALQGDLIG